MALALGRQLGDLLDVDTGLRLVAENGLKVGKLAVRVKGSSCNLRVEGLVSVWNRNS